MSEQQSKYHVNPLSGRTSLCRAKKKCPFGERAHFNSPEEAYRAFEEGRKDKLFPLVKRAELFPAPVLKPPPPGGTSLNPSALEDLLPKADLEELRKKERRTLTEEAVLAHLEGALLLEKVNLTLAFIDQELLDHYKDAALQGASEESSQRIATLSAKRFRIIKQILAPEITFGGPLTYEILSRPNPQEDNSAFRLTSEHYPHVREALDLAIASMPSGFLRSMAKMKPKLKIQCIPFDGRELGSYDRRTGVLTYVNPETICSKRTGELLYLTESEQKLKLASHFVHELVHRVEESDSKVRALTERTYVLRTSSTGCRQDPYSYSEAIRGQIRNDKFIELYSGATYEIEDAEDLTRRGVELLPVASESFILGRDSGFTVMDDKSTALLLGLATRLEKNK